MDHYYPVRHIVLCCLFLCLAWPVWAQVGSSGYLEQGQVIRFSYDTAVISRKIDEAAALRLEFPDSSIALLRETLRQSQASAFTNGIIKSYAHIANVYAQNRIYEKAIYYYNRAIHYCLGVPSYRGYLAVLSNNIGINYQAQKLYDKAIIYFHKAAQYAERYPSPISGAHVYNNLYSLYSFIGKDKEAAFYLGKAKLLLNSKDVSGQTMFLINEGNYYMDQEAYQKAEGIFKDALGLVEKNKLDNLRCLALTNLAISYIKQGNPKPAFIIKSAGSEV